MLGAVNVEKLIWGETLHTDIKLSKRAYMPFTLKTLEVKVNLRSVHLSNLVGQ